MYYYSMIVVSLLLSAAFMPLIIRFAQKKKLYDSTGGRKIHTGKVPRLGGVGMAVAFFAVTGFFLIIGRPYSLAARLSTLFPLALGAVCMHVLGLVDDIKTLSAKKKFFIQSIIAFFVIASGFRFRSLGYSPDVFSGQWKWLSFVISWGWIVGITNAVNMIDGLDGLAGGIVVIVSAGFGIFYFLGNDMPSFFICMTLASIVIGFLSANFPAPKAKLFMGDSGSLFLGFMLSVMPFLGGTASAPNVVEKGNAAGLLPSMALLALPMIDTLRAIVRRVRAGVQIDSPDRKHIHHLFLDQGYKTGQILLRVYALTVLQVAFFLVGAKAPVPFSYFINLLSLTMVGAFFLYAVRIASRRA